jgi:hypothetical protein
LAARLSRFPYQEFQRGHRMSFWSFPHGVIRRCCTGFAVIEIRCTPIPTWRAPPGSKRLSCTDDVLTASVVGP